MTGIDIGSLVAGVTALVTAVTTLVKLIKHQNVSEAVHAELKGVDSGQPADKPPAI